MANEKTTWDLDALTAAQKSILDEVCNTNDGAMYVDAADVGASREAYEELVKLGLISLDSSLDDDSNSEIGVALTPEGEAWLLSLPEGALS